MKALYFSNMKDNNPLNLKVESELLMVGGLRKYRFYINFPVESHGRVLESLKHIEGIFSIKIIDRRYPPRSVCQFGLLEETGTHVTVRENCRCLWYANIVVKTEQFII